MGSGEDIDEAVGALLGRCILAVEESKKLRSCRAKLVLLNTDLWFCQHDSGLGEEE